MGHQMKAEIETAVRQLSRADPGEQKYLASYQKGLNKVCNDLTPEEKAEFKREAEEWNDQSPPPEVQAR